MSDYSSLAPSSPFEGSTFKIPNSQFMFGAFCRFEAGDVVQLWEWWWAKRIWRGGGFPSLRLRRCSSSAGMTEQRLAAVTQIIKPTLVCCAVYVFWNFPHLGKCPQIWFEIHGTCKLLKGLSLPAGVQFEVQSLTDARWRINCVDPHQRSPSSVEKQERDLDSQMFIRRPFESILRLNTFIESL